jgi:hypothetical protein
MADDGTTEFHRALKALLDRYPKGRVLAALQEGNPPIRPGPKRTVDTPLLIFMGRIMTWHRDPRDLSIRKAAEIATRHLPDILPDNTSRLSVIDRIRKRFSPYYLKLGKFEEIIFLTLLEKDASCSSSAEEFRERRLKRLRRMETPEKLVCIKIPDDDTLEATFQKLRAALQAVHVIDDNGSAVMVKLGGLRRE